MYVEISNLCQSGEKAITSGIYRLVETNSADDTGTFCTVRRGEFFPHQQGQEVCWYLVRALPERKATAPLHMVWEDDPDQLG